MYIDGCMLGAMYVSGHLQQCHQSTHEQTLTLQKRAQNASACVQLQVSKKLVFSAVQWIILLLHISKTGTATHPTGEEDQQDCLVCANLHR